MAAPADKLAASLAILKELQDAGRVALRAADMTRTHRERLLRNGFIRKVMKGWYVPSRPDEPAGESTSWYVSFWQFCAAYLESRSPGVKLSVVSSFPSWMMETEDNVSHEETTAYERV